MREALDRNGYAVVPGALRDDALERLKRAFDAVPQSSGTQHVTIGEDTPELGAWRALEAHASIAAAAEQILGRPYRLRELHGRNPLPGYGQQGLHADWTALAPNEPYMVVTALFMIDAFTRDNGATRVVPGSHRFRRSVPKQLAQPLASHPDETIVAGPAGALLVFNGHLWHSGRRNDSAGPRRAVQLVALAQ